MLQPRAALLSRFFPGGVLDIPLPDIEKALGDNVLSRRLSHAPGVFKEVSEPGGGGGGTITGFGVVGDEQT